MSKIKSQKVKTDTVIKRIKPELPGGFRDYGPADAILRQRLMEKIRKTFEDFGFDPLETPAVERTEVLTGGEENAKKIIFNLESSADKKSDTSLRFDLTLPLARFLAANPEFPKPFKRYQIGQAWRGESPQSGRFREFLQADIDIVGSSSMEADTEIVTVIIQTFKNLGLNRFLIKINNRKVLNCLPGFAGLPEKRLQELLRIIDKKDKIGWEETKKEMVRTFKKKAAEKVAEFLGISGDAKAKLLGVRELFRGCVSAEEGVKELAEIVRGLRAAGVEEKNWEIDLSMVRGLGYYTGPIFEAVLTDAKNLGSVFSGGRYDNLMERFGQKLPAVGASVGVDRLFAALDTLGLLKRKQTNAKVIILNLSEELRPEYFSLAQDLRSANINTILYLGDDRSFQAQFAYAVKKEIPYVIIYGDGEKRKGVYIVKNLASREQKEVLKGNIRQYFKK